MEKLKENKKLIIPLILVALVFILGAAYAWLTQVLNGTQINRIKAGVLELTLDDRTSDGIDLEYAVPQSDSQGLNNTAYTFTVKNTGGMNAEYKLYLEDEEIEGTRISDSNIKYNLVKNNGEDNPKILSSRELESTIINGGSTNEYSLKLWIDSEATQSEVANKVFKAKIKLEAVQSENSSDDKYDVEGTITKDGNPVTSGTVVVYPEGISSPVSGTGEFNIPNLDYGDHNGYYVPDGNNTSNMTEDQIKNTTGVIPVKIIVNPGNRIITPGQGYEITMNVEKKVVKSGDHIYLKHQKENGVIIGDSIPDVCLESDRYDGVLCLRSGEYNTSLSKMQNYFAFDSNTWTKVVIEDQTYNEGTEHETWYYEAEYTSPDGKITCTETEGGEYIDATGSSFTCNDGKIKAYIHRSYGWYSYDSVGIDSVVANTRCYTRSNSKSSDPDSYYCVEQ